MKKFTRAVVKHSDDEEGVMTRRNDKELRKSERLKQTHSLFGACNVWAQTTQISLPSTPAATRLIYNRVICSRGPPKKNRASRSAERKKEKNVIESEKTLDRSLSLSRPAVSRGRSIILAHFFSFFFFSPLCPAFVFHLSVTVLYRHNTLNLMHSFILF